MRMSGLGCSGCSGCSGNQVHGGGCGTLGNAARTTPNVTNQFASDMLARIGVAQRAGQYSFAHTRSAVALPDHPAHGVAGLGLARHAVAPIVPYHAARAPT